MNNIGALVAMIGAVEFGSGVALSLRPDAPAPMIGDGRRRQSQRPHYSGSRKCAAPVCGKTISANKRFCHEHAIQETKNAGLWK